MSHPHPAYLFLLFAIYLVILGTAQENISNGFTQLAFLFAVVGLLGGLADRFASNLY